MLKYFNNSWTGNSWSEKEKKGDTIPVFWTKDKNPISTPIDREWERYNRKHPGVGRRITYDVYNTFDKVLAAYRKFLKETAGEEEVHVWIQGTLHGVGPGEMLAMLKKERHKTNSPDDRLLILAGPYTGKTTAAKAGKAVDIELQEEGRYFEANEAYKKNRTKAMDDIRRKAYTDEFNDAIDSDARAVIGHFGMDALRKGKAAKRDVRVVVLKPEVLRSRIDQSDDDDKVAATRSAAAAEQLASVIHWMQSNNEKVYSSIDQALKEEVKQ